jgi:BirA family biotin operon repressor/biotin-[acetyl-CoA-carboxylase] ligase
MMKIINKDSVSNTNEELKAMARDGAKSMTMLCAKEQTAGRGRHGREWKSKAGNLHASILLRGIPQEKAHELVFIAALAVVETVESFLFDQEVTLKWPNDVLVDGKKIAGILLESEISGSDLDFVVIGIGLNVAATPEGLDGMATSFKDFETQVDLSEVKQLLGEAFTEYLEIWLDSSEAGGFERIGNLWMQYAAFLDKEISVKLPQGEVRGIFKGMNAKGEMILEKAGVENLYSSAEIFEI